MATERKPGWPKGAERPGQRAGEGALPQLRRWVQQHPRALVDAEWVAEQFHVSIKNAKTMLWMLKGEGLLRKRTVAYSLINLEDIDRHA